jgi:magnesium transporter
MAMVEGIERKVRDSVSEMAGAAPVPAHISFTFFPHRNTPRGMFKSRHPIPGTAPATLAPLAPGEGMPTKIHLVTYDTQGIKETPIRCVADLPPRDVNDGKLHWIEFNGLAEFDELRALGEKYDLHPLALEDVVHAGQRPKVDSYEGQLFIVAQMLYRDETGCLCGEQVSFFLMKGFLISIQEESDSDVFEPVRERLRVGRGYIRKLGPDYLAYALLDAIIDHCFPILECIGEALEELEDELLAAPSRTCIARLHEYRRTLVHLRRAVWPERDLINGLLHEDGGLVSKQTKVFLRDAYDHAVRIMDLVESYRDLTASMLELYLSSVSQRTNEIMRVLTVISAIFIPLTFVVGIYGMNFEYMPEIKQPWGYFACLAVMATIAGCQIAFFKRKGWL